MMITPERRSWMRRCAGFAVAASMSACAIAAPSSAPMGTDVAMETDPWRQIGQEALAARLANGPNHARAKNVIIFLADGASPTFFTAARIRDGQLLGEIGDSHDAPQDLFPHTALAKVYATNGRVPDSAATATAIFTGVKTHIGGVGVPADVETCVQSLVMRQSNLADLAQESGRRIGVITTSVIVDASPAAVFAHAPTRRWLDPRRLTDEDRAAGCHDLPEQLIAANLDVALGGGLAVFTSEDDGGVRADGRNLVTEWTSAGDGRIFVADGDELAAFDRDATEQLFGLFSPAEMFNAPPPGPADGPTTSPTLTELTAAALDVLDRGDAGYVLMVEQEGTDEFQHAGRLLRALDSGVEMFDAVRMTLERVDLSETLVIVTADHGQPLAFGGGSTLEDPIMSLSHWRGPLDMAQDGAPFSVLGFYVGPHGRVADADLSNEDLNDPAYVPDAAVPLGIVTHSAVDVPVYATGPWSDLFSGVMEQSTIFALVRHAMENGE